MKEKKTLTTFKEVKAMSDPFKYRILMTFYKMEQPATVKQIADSINEVPAKVHYHVKKMEDAGIIQLVYTKEINGIIAKFYEPTAKDFEIKCSDELEESNKNLRLAQSQQMISDFYNISKNTFLDQISYCAQTKGKIDGKIMLEDLYLTDEEALEFSKYISDYFEKYKNKTRNMDGINKHHCFVSTIKIKNDK